MVSPLLSRADVFSFEPVIRARAATLGPMSVAVDGGAGWGDTAKAIVASVADDGVVYAFEPFPGNHKFFEGCDRRIKLHKLAIADAVGTANFVVPRVVQAGEAWAEKGLAGYSSVGYLGGEDATPAWKRLAHKLRGTAPQEQHASRLSFPVEVTTLAQVVHKSHIDFVKLDLQGAEYKAVLGMGALLAATDMLWVEFSNQPGLFDLLRRQGFLMFDTNYLCAGASDSQLASVGLEARQEINLSTAQPAVLARRLFEQNDYVAWFDNAKQTAGLYQTDLLCINPAFVKAFFKVLGSLA